MSEVGYKVEMMRIMKDVERKTKINIKNYVKNWHNHRETETTKQLKQIIVVH